MFCPRHTRGPDEDVRVTCDVTSQRGESQRILCQNFASANIRVSAQPQDNLEFRFKLSDMKNMDLEDFSVDDPELQFEATESAETMSPERVFFVTCCCKTKDLNLSLTFELKDKTTLRKITLRKNVIVIVKNEIGPKANPYQNKNWTAEKYVRAVEAKVDDRTNTIRHVSRADNLYDVPRELRALLDDDFEPQNNQCQEKAKIYKKLNLIKKQDRNAANYENYYHHLLWLDEIEELKNIEKYNMSKVILKKERAKRKPHSTNTKLEMPCYALEVPGLSQKRPSIMPGDRAIISRYDPETDVVKYEHEGYIKSIKRNEIFIVDFDRSFEKIFNSNTRFNVRFIANRAALESQHRALEIFDEWRSRLFPQPVAYVEPRKIERFFNPIIGKNAEQKVAVEHILSRTSDPAPYLVFGPPGTGKTMTIVETIIQIVAASASHRVWVCTNSNMAADHVALQLLKYKPLLGINHFLLRVNSKDRDWKSMQKELRTYSNASSRKKFMILDNRTVSAYRIVVTTLLHAWKYTKPQFDCITKETYEVEVSHLFIDEAAQATEPSCLVPMKLLAQGGQLVLAGDPCQLGPVIKSKLAKEFGLGTSLMEHLYNKFGALYGDACPHSHQYITMLVNNFRSDADILAIPNEKFYSGKLKAQAPLDPLSRVSILEKEGGDRSIVFHSVHTKAQKQGTIPSYMNKGEFKMVQTYITALVDVHKVPPRDIGVISPYIRQVALIKEWLLKKNYKDLEVGTVEAFQGKEKRVIIVSTVRGGGTPSGDLRADLGFLVDEKRFNVAVTRAKAKLIVVGNQLFLKQDELWKCYIQRCEILHTLHDESSPTLEGLLDNLSIDDSDEPSFSPELECFVIDEPSFSSELDCLVHAEPSFSLDLDDLLSVEPSFSPEPDDLLYNEPSFSPEPDDLLYEPSFSPEPPDIFDDFLF